jgi:hypothetical protein
VESEQWWRDLILPRGADVREEMETATSRQDLTEVFSSRHCLLEWGVYQKAPVPKELFEVREADDHLCIFSFVVHARSSMNAGSCGGRRSIAV